MANKKIAVEPQTGWFGEKLINELRVILKNNYGREHDDMELQSIGLNVARFVYASEACHAV